MKLKKTTNDLIESDFELETGDVFDDAQYQRIHDLYFKDHVQDASLAGRVVHDRTRVLISHDDDIVHTYEIALSVQYDETGTPVDGGLFLADIYQPPQLNDNVYTFSQDFSEIGIDHPIFDALKGQPLINIHPDEQLMDAELAPALFLGSYEDIENELILQFMAGHIAWINFITV